MHANLHLSNTIPIAKMCLHYFYLFSVNAHGNKSQGPVKSGIANRIKSNFHTLCDHEQIKIIPGYYHVLYL